MKSYELRALKKLNIQTKNWGNDDRVRVLSNTGRYTYISNVATTANLRKVAKANPKSFPKSSTLDQRVEIIKNAFMDSKPKYRKDTTQVSETHTFQGVGLTEVLSRISQILRSKTKAFKVAIEIGFTLVNIVDGSRQYWSPAHNTRF